MILLALETATEACSAALLCDGELRERYEVAPRRHAELILPMIDGLLAEAGIARSQLDAIAVGRGPGAFTGVRLAIALAQGIALALDRPVVLVSTLAALALTATSSTGEIPAGAASAATGATVSTRPVAAEAAPGAPSILAAIDARMGDLYAGVFHVDSDGLVEAEGIERLAKPVDLALPSPRIWIVAGSGWAGYAPVLRAALGADPVLAFPDALPRAAAVARLGARDYVRGLGVDAAQAQPVYLRDKVALTLAEQAKVPPRLP